jgi:hypothetical protein
MAGCAGGAPSSSRSPMTPPAQARSISLIWTTGATVVSFAA